MRRSARPKPRKSLKFSPLPTPPSLSKEEVAIKLIRGIWGSLESHLDYCVENSSEGRSFHRTCVKEYAAQIKLASDLL